MKREDVLRKIAKLLALATDQEGSAEGAQAFLRAEKLKAQYDIEEAELHTNPNAINSETVACPRASWRRHIWSTLGKYTGVVVVFQIGEGFLTLVGQRPDRQICIYLAEIVFRQAEAALKVHLVRQARHEPGWKASRKYLNRWRNGFAVGLERKVADLLVPKINEATDHALQRLDKMTSLRRDALLWAHVHIGLKDHGSRVTYSSDGEDAGYDARLTSGIGRGGGPAETRLLGAGG